MKLKGCGGIRSIAVPRPECMLVPCHALDRHHHDLQAMPVGHSVLLRASAASL
jgi:hypothetical protein